MSPVDRPVLPSPEDVPPGAPGTGRSIVILSSRPDLYSTRRLLEEATLSGATVEVVDHRRLTLGIGDRPQVMFERRELHPDVVIPRIGTRSTRYGAAVLRQFQVMGVRSTLAAPALLVARDKLACMQTLALAKVPVVATGAARSPSGLSEVLDMVDGTPVVVKLAEGTQGSGVVLAETRKAAESLLAAFNALGAEYLVQPFVKEAGGSDLRVVVVGNKVAAAMERRAAPGEFRANIHQGAEGHPVRLTRRERTVALRAARAVGTTVAGVDLLRTQDGPRVLEVNASPGLQGVERATGVNVARAVVDHALSLLG